MTAEARVAGLRIYPVKSLRGLDRSDVAVELWGFAHDRRWMAVQPDGRFMTQRELAIMARLAVEPTATGLRLTREGADPLDVPLPSAGASRRTVRVWNDTVPALDCGAEAAAWLTAALDRPCGLVFLDDTTARPVDPERSLPGDHTAFSDGFPVLLTTTGSLAALNGALRRPIGMERFRPNLILSGTEPWAEDRWRRIRIGAVVFRVAGACGRCIVTTTDQETGERPDKSEPLRTLGRLRRTAEGVMFGQNLIPETEGRIALGDPVEILESGESNVMLLAAAE